MAERLCFFGHTHKQAGFVLRGRRAAVVPLDEFLVNDGGRYLVNVGSVGQPRDGDPRAAFTLYDDETESVRFVRVEYDIETAARKIADAALPSLLAFRLWLGR
jgi:diadenosine tetraphosphatase ApaH/serine/threonine PP2A family protein phosphatase